MVFTDVIYQHGGADGGRFYRKVPALRVFDALQHGFAPFVVSDACAGRRQVPHGANLFDLQAKYAETRNSADTVGDLKKRWLSVGSN